MGRGHWIAALVVAAFALTGAAGAVENWIQLRDGVKARFLAAQESTDSAKPKTLSVSFALSDPAIVADHKRVIEVADQLFGRVVILSAEEKEYARAIVNLLQSETKVGEDTVQVFEDFQYVRGKNGVWLRQAGTQSWKVAQDPTWTPAKSEAVVLSTGVVYVDFVGEVFPPAGATKALGIELHSATVATNIPAKYAEIKEIYNRLDKAKLTQAGFDFVHLENYGEPLRGRFQVRKRVYVDISRAADGTWPALPDTAPFKDSKDPLVAGLGLEQKYDATLFAQRAVLSIVPVSERSEGADGFTLGIAVRSSGLFVQGPKASSALEYLTPQQ